MHRFLPRSHAHGQLAQTLNYECTKSERGRTDTIRITINEQDCGMWRIPSDFVFRQEARQRYANFLLENSMLEDNVPDILGRRTGVSRVSAQSPEDQPHHWRFISLNPPPREMGSPNSPANISNFIDLQSVEVNTEEATVHTYVPPPPPLPSVKRPPPRRPPEMTPERRSATTERVD